MTVPALSNRVKSILTRAGTENPDGDAREIVAAAIGCGTGEINLFRDSVPDDAQVEKALDMAKRRASGEPIQYIIGSWSFMGREYKVGKGVLIPRDDTEVVVGEALRLIRSVPRPVIADLCSGSGIIAVTLERELPDSEVYAVEKSPEAYAYLTENAALNGSGIIPVLADLRDCADGFDDGSLDLLISNPPYIRSSDIPSLQSEVQYEPRLALDGGESGFDFYDLITGIWTPKVKTGGIIAFEIGEEQFGRIEELLLKTGFTDIKGYPDIQGITRAVTAVKL